MEKNLNLKYILLIIIIRYVNSVVKMVEQLCFSYNTNKIYLKLIKLILFHHVRAVLLDIKIVNYGHAVYFLKEKNLINI